MRHFNENDFIFHVRKFASKMNIEETDGEESKLSTEHLGPSCRNVFEKKFSLSVNRSEWVFDIFD